jgi:lycopene cyclase domain-containing protein
MTYFGFLLRFLLVPILILLVITYWDNKNRRKITGFRDGRAVWIAIGIHILLAVIYTTPWDNYLVATRVWYYNPKLVTGLILGYVPVEEYTFFVLETVFAGLWWWFLARRIFPLQERPEVRDSFFSNKRLVYVSACVVGFVWLLFTYLSFSGEAKWTYLSITLFWALPPIFIQLLFGADILWYYRRLVSLAILIPSIYLSMMDMIALKETTWSISPAQTTGVLFLGILPFEEVVFFFVTNILVTFGMTLLLANLSQERMLKIRGLEWIEN